MNAAEITTPLRLEYLQTKIVHDKQITFTLSDDLDSYEAYFDIINGLDKVAVLCHMIQFIEMMRMCGCTDTATWEKVMVRTMWGMAADYWITT